MLLADTLETQQSGYVYVVRDGVVMYESDPIPNFKSDELTETACSIFLPTLRVLFITIFVIVAAVLNPNWFIITMSVFCSLASALAVCLDYGRFLRVQSTRKDLNGGGDWMIRTDLYSFVRNDSGDPICVHIELLGATRTAAMRAVLPNTRQKLPYRSFEYSRMHILKDLR